MTTNKTWLTIPEVAEYLQVPRTKVYNLVHIRDFPSVKLGNNWRIHRDKLDKWLEKRMQDKPENWM